MISARKALSACIGLYRLRLDDIDLVRAQFHAFLKQIPLLYFILAGNAAAVAIASRHIPHPYLTRVVPAVLGFVAVARGIWWWQRKFSDFSDRQICTYIRMTSLLAAVLAMVCVVWIMLLFPYGNAIERGHFIFLLAITQISCVFCLMPVRSAALGVATIGMVPFTGYFLFVDHGQMWVEAVMFGFVAVGMLSLLNRYNQLFAALIGSQRDLHARQLEAERLGEETVASPLPTR